MNIKRESIYVAALDPVIGKEISKTRPVVVVSNDINNQYSGTVTIIPITSKNLQKIYPFEVLLAKGRVFHSADRFRRLAPDPLRRL